MTQTSILHCECGATCSEDDEECPECGAPRIDEEETAIIDKMISESEAN